MSVPQILVSDEQIRKHYATAEIQLPPNARFRQFKLALRNGAWFRVARRIRNAQELRRFLTRLCPVGAYVSVGCWLDPRQLRGFKQRKAGYDVASKILLRSDYFWEVDADLGQPNAKKRAFSQLCHAYHLLSRKHSNFGFAETHRGFQLRCYDWYDSFASKVPPLPNDRIRFVQQQMIKTTRWLRKEGVVWDFKQSVNVFQVGRVFGGLHRSGTVVNYANSLEELAANSHFSGIVPKIQAVGCN